MDIDKLKQKWLKNIQDTMKARDEHECKEHKAQLTGMIHAYENAIYDLSALANVDASENTLPIQRVSNSLLSLDGKTIPVTFHVSKFEPKIDIDLSNDC